MIYLIVCIVLLLVGGLLVWRRSNPEADAGMYQLMVALHLFRRRFDVFQCKVELRRGAAALRRQLRDELSDLDKRELLP